MEFDAKYKLVLSLLTTVFATLWYAAFRSAFKVLAAQRKDRDWVDVPQAYHWIWTSQVNFGLIFIWLLTSGAPAISYFVPLASWANVEVGSRQDSAIVNTTIYVPTNYSGPVLSPADFARLRGFRIPKGYVPQPPDTTLHSSKFWNYSNPEQLEGERKFTFEGLEVRFASSETGWVVKLPDDANSFNLDRGTFGTLQVHSRNNSVLRVKFMVLPQVENNRTYPGYVLNHCNNTKHVMNQPGCVIQQATAAYVLYLKVRVYDLNYAPTTFPDEFRRGYLSTIAVYDVQVTQQLLKTACLGLCGPYVPGVGLLRASMGDKCMYRNATGGVYCQGPSLDFYEYQLSMDLGQGDFYMPGLWISRPDLGTLKLVKTTHTLIVKRAHWLTFLVLGLVAFIFVLWQRVFCTTYYNLPFQIIQLATTDDVNCATPLRTRWKRARLVPLERIKHISISFGANGEDAHPNPGYYKSQGYKGTEELGFQDTPHQV